MSAHLEIVQNFIYVDPVFSRAKRVLDISVILALSPFILLISMIVAISIWLDSGGPILFHQKRVGINGSAFHMLKFRTMYENCDDAIHRRAINQYMNGQRIGSKETTPYKLTNDPRITCVGRFLRKFSLDEFPQFWNVLRGEMSLVGPRPPLPYEVELYSSHDWLRLSGKPGLTGQWQVAGRNQVTFQQMVEMDIDYLQRQTIIEDIKIILCTFPALVGGRGE